ncbi:hypothetical protein J437_LFUL017459 [Ladona fulva]|uniref:CCHC-type domain-containing protein n=1 Tax=Ladona fulva TaxID=123851 RepID=A0A8K0KP83_LADFU|nr:hypothetical protein J437_LFUL017459 [Ladona fulva]
MGGIRDELRTLSCEMQAAVKLEEWSKNKVSYSDVVKDLQKESQDKKEVIIMAKDDKKIEDVEMIKEIVKKTINPGQDFIRVERMRRAGTKKLIIETKTQEEKDKIYKGELKQRLEAQGLKVEALKKKIQRETLISKDKIYEGWMSHYVKDYLNVTRCYKCQGFGHTAQSCREKKDICPYCAKAGHRYDDCPNKDKDEVCANCHRFGKEDSHSTSDRDCPAYRYALEREILRTGYSKN